MRETRVENGALRGVACGWPSITAYYGIPYAAPPVGENRWRPPLPAADWEGVRDCARPSARCPQLGVGKGSFYEHEFYPVEEPMSEDCLYLNVWTPAKSPEDRLPVIFWVHGGAFMTGYGHSAHFDGEPFARQGVILVTINYRLNVFAWMVHPELDAESPRGVSGNYGLLDQIFALQWVRRNIAAFGGDPDRITIAGQSAGAMSIQNLLSTPLTRGMFRAAILQSGGGPTPMHDMRYPTLAQAEERSDLSALGVNSIAEARSLPAMELLRRWAATMPSPAVQRTPVVDGWVLPDSLDALARRGEFARVPCLIGGTADEGLPPHEDYAGFTAAMLREYGEEKGRAFMALVPEAEYPAYKKLHFAESIRAAAEAWALILERCNLPAYVYHLDRKLPGDDRGAFHAADLWYVFDTLRRSWRPWQREDYWLGYACSTYWASFARDGVPRGRDLPEWTPYTAADPRTMEVGERIGMVTLPENPRVTLRREFLLGK
ncbi:MAG: carboxylesterase family protein [Oscillospiraceae bacterium]|nr:carboxylesterase family protein [Oscillospiraceae bacterium]